MTPARRVTLLAAAWTSALAWLAWEWARTPLSGSGPAFLAWSLPAVPLAALSWSWLRRLALAQLALRARLAALIAGAWAGVAAVSATRFGAEWVLDGLILRNPAQEAAGIALRWLPGATGAALSVGFLAAALEARYRLRHPDTES